MEFIDWEVADEAVATPRVRVAELSNLVAIDDRMFFGEDRCRTERTCHRKLDIRIMSRRWLFRHDDYGLRPRMSPFDSSRPESELTTWRRDRVVTPAMRALDFRSSSKSRKDWRMRPGTAW